MSREQVVLRTLVGLTDSLVSGYDAFDLLTLLSQRCIEGLDVDAAGVMLASPAEVLRVVASSSEAMRTLELFEQQSLEGPCQDCFRSGSPVTTSSLADMLSRWPRFGPQARDAGFEGVVALPMHVGQRTVGALNLFRARAGHMPQPELDAAQAVADVATIAVLQQRNGVAAHVVNDQLQEALNVRLTIEQAKGFLAERTGSMPDRAFQLIAEYARDHKRPVAEVCLAIIDGTIDSTAFDPSR